MRVFISMKVELAVLIEKLESAGAAIADPLAGLHADRRCGGAAAA
jgi:hypothetical protein